MSSPLTNISKGIQTKNNTVMQIKETKMSDSSFLPITLPYGLMLDLLSF